MADPKSIDEALELLAGHGVSPLAGASLPSVFMSDDWPYGVPPDAIEVELFGEADDHLRLVSLVAEGARRWIDRDVVDCCLDPKRPWKERRSAFQYALRALRRRAPLYIVDLDALEPDGPSGEDERVLDWDDHTFVRQRREVLSDVLKWAPEADHWMFLRPAPKRSLSERMVALGVDIELPDDIQDVVDESPEPLAWRRLLLGLPPAYRRLALARQRRRGVPAGDADADADALLRKSWARVKRARMSSGARVVGALRGRQMVNGVYGPLRIDDVRRPDPSIDRLSIEGLTRAGWLSDAATAEGHEARRMHRPLRQFVDARSEAGELVEQVHAHVAGRDLEPLPLAERLEVHHHAIKAGDVARAIETVTCYVGHLRQLAIQRSQEHRFSDAVRLYRAVLTHDEADAYAWEYLGYNLGRGGDDPKAARDALTRACRLEPDNPLYEGRLLGFLAEQGQDIEPRFDRRMSHYRSGQTDWTAIRYFAEPVLKGVARGGHNGPMPEKSVAIGRRLTRRWGSTLTRLDRLQPFTAYPWWQSG